MLRRGLLRSWLCRGAGCSGLILVTCGVALAEANPSSARRPWLKSVPGREATPPPEGDASTAEPLERGFRREGFFARLAVGSGWFSAYSGSSGDERSFTGAPLSLEAYLGNTPLPWLGVGAGYSRDDIGGLSSEDDLVDGDEPDLESTSFHLEAVSAFLTLYPTPASPFYGFATLGLAALRVQSGSEAFELPLFNLASNLAGSDPSGLILSLGGGYDWWIDRSWTLGVSGRVLGALLSARESASSERVTLFMPSLLLTLGYH